MKPVEFWSELAGDLRLGKGENGVCGSAVCGKTSTGCMVQPIIDIEMLGQQAAMIFHETKMIFHAVPMITSAIPNDKHQAERFPEVPEVL